MQITVDARHELWHRANMKTIDVNCIVCGKAIKARSRDLKRGRGMTCSHKCSAKRKHILYDQTGCKNPNFKGSLALSKYQHKLSFRKKYPEKAFAHDVFAAAIRAGKIKRNPCEKCGSTKSEGHHEDYSKPLDVVWLCKKHHREHEKSCRARHNFVRKPDNNF